MRDKTTYGIEACFTTHGGHESRSDALACTPTRHRRVASLLACDPGSLIPRALTAEESELFNRVRGAWYTESMILRLRPEDLKALKAEAEKRFLPASELIRVTLRKAGLLPKAPPTPYPMKWQHERYASTAPIKKKSKR